jgi:hypothetical protein
MERCREPGRDHLTFNLSTINLKLSTNIMSKKVLKLTGQRPMLLAIIMATLTLGLLFSGWFTPTSLQAQTGGAILPLAKKTLTVRATRPT